MEEIGIVPTESYASTSATPAAAPTTERSGRDAFLYFKKLQQQLEFLNTMEDYVVCFLPLMTER